MKKKYLIGEMANYHDISIQTLRYYDRIDLFKPKLVDKKNGYRYYTLDQFEQLNIIKHLRKIGISLKDIKKFLKSKDINCTLNLLEMHMEITQERLKELTLINDRVKKKYKQLKEALKINENIETIKIKKIPSRKLLVLEVKDLNFDEEFELAFLKLEKVIEKIPSAFLEKVGVQIPIENIKKKEFQKISKIFSLIEEDPDEYKSSTETLLEGDYACIYHKGCYSETDKSYKKLLEFIDDNGYEIIGDSIEIGLIDLAVTQNKDEFLTEIQIPVKKSLSL